jgi:uncharacterized membrane protein
VTGTGTIPIATVSPTSLPFGNQARNTTSAATPVTVTNTGTATLTGININIGGANANRFNQTNNCGTTLAVGASCTINVTFRPNQTGPVSATLNVNVATPATPAAVPLTGTGI